MERERNYDERLRSENGIGLAGDRARQELRAMRLERHGQIKFLLERSQSLLRTLKRIQIIRVAFKFKFEIPNNHLNLRYLTNT